MSNHVFGQLTHICGLNELEIPQAYNKSYYMPMGNAHYNVHYIITLNLFKNHYPVQL